MTMRGKPFYENNILRAPEDGRQKQKTYLRIVRNNTSKHYRYGSEVNQSQGRFAPLQRVGRRRRHTRSL